MTQSTVQGGDDSDRENKSKIHIAAALRGHFHVCNVPVGCQLRHLPQLLFCTKPHFRLGICRHDFGSNRLKYGHRRRKPDKDGKLRNGFPQGNAQIDRILLCVLLLIKTFYRPGQKLCLHNRRRRNRRRCISSYKCGKKIGMTPMMCIFDPASVFLLKTAFAVCPMRGELYVRIRKYRTYRYDETARGRRKTCRAPSKKCF